MREVSEIFMDPGEKKSIVLGEGYLYRFLKDDILQGWFCVLTDRRMYFKGRFLHSFGKAYQANKGEHTIDIKDVTGSGFANVRFGAFFVLEILFVIVLTLLTGLFLFVVGEVEHYHFRMEDIVWGCTILLIVGLVAAPIYYIVKPFRVFIVEYTTGKIAFLAYDYLEDDIRAFQKELHRAKDADTFRQVQEDGSGDFEKIE